MPPEIAEIISLYCGSIFSSEVEQRCLLFCFYLTLKLT